LFIVNYIIISGISLWMKGCVKLYKESDDTHFIIVYPFKGGGV